MRVKARQLLSYLWMIASVGTAVAQPVTTAPHFNSGAYVVANFDGDGSDPLNIVTVGSLATNFNYATYSGYRIGSTGPTVATCTIPSCSAITATATNLALHIYAGIVDYGFSGPSLEAAASAGFQYVLTLHAPECVTQVCTFSPVISMGGTFGTNNPFREDIGGYGYGDQTPVFDSSGNQTRGQNLETYWFDVDGCAFGTIIPPNCFGTGPTEQVSQTLNTYPYTVLSGQPFEVMYYISCGAVTQAHTQSDATTYDSLDTCDFSQTGSISGVEVRDSAGNLVIDYTITSATGELWGPNGVTANACDISQQGYSRVADVQTVINQALGLSSPANDLNGDGAVNVVDAQIVIDAALGMGCTASHDSAALRSSAMQDGRHAPSPVEDASSHPVVRAVALGTLGGASSTGYGLNNRGQVVGVSDTRGI